MWLRAFKRQSRTFLYEVLLACYYFYCLWCWSCLFSTSHLFIYNYLLIYYHPPFGSYVWVCLWWLVMGLVSLSFSCYIVLLGILISVFGTSLTTSHLLIWRFLVIGSLSVCGWLKAKINSDTLVLYFVVSVIGSLLFLISCGTVFFSSLLIQLALLLKLGLAPFQFWVLKVLSCLDIPSLCFFLGPLKVGLLWLVVNSIHPSIILASASMVLGIIILWLSSHSYLVLYASGSCQLLILVLLGPSAFALYYSIYLLALLGVNWFCSGYISSFFAFLGLGGLPPLTIFWAKVLALLCLPFIYAGLVILVSLLSFWPYILCSVGLSRPSHTSFLHILLLISCPIFLVTLHW